MRIFFGPKLKDNSLKILFTFAFSEKRVSYQYIFAFYRQSDGKTPIHFWH